MKKQKKIEVLNLCAAYILFVIVAFLVAGLSFGFPGQNWLNSKKRAEVERIYEEKTDSGVYSLDYYGTYNGCMVAKIAGDSIDYALSYCMDDIDGVKIYYRDSNTLLVFKDNEMAELHEAYEANWISKASLFKIAQKQNTKAFGPFYFLVVRDWGGIPLGL